MRRTTLPSLPGTGPARTGGTEADTDKASRTILGGGNTGFMIRIPVGFQTGGDTTRLARASWFTHRNRDFMQTHGMALGMGVIFQPADMALYAEDQRDDPS
jgi:hypothetical protein